MNALEIVSKYFKVTKRSIGPYAKVVAKKYTYNTECYTIEGIGNLCIIDEPGLFGLVHLYTVVITPFEVDAPIYMVENMKIPFRRLLIAEMFDSFINERTSYPSFEEIKNKHPNLSTFESSIYWSKKYALPESYYVAESKKKLEEINIAWEEYLEEYCKILTQAPKCDPYFKTIRDDLYVEDLLKNGGPQRDHLLKAYDIQYISRLYREIVFATERKDYGN